MLRNFSTRCRPLGLALVLALAGVLGSVTCAKESPDVPATGLQAQELTGSAETASSVADRPLGSARLVATLGVGAVDTLTETVVLPADLAPGAYWLGVCANYDPAALPAFGIEEVSLLNNCATASAATASWC